MFFQPSLPVTLLNEVPVDHIEGEGGGGVPESAEKILDGEVGWLVNVLCMPLSKLMILEAAWPPDLQALQPPPPTLKFKVC